MIKYQDEFRDSQIAKFLLSRIRATTTREWIIMEICGGQTHAIMQNGLEQLLPGRIELVHGPGCPVCVTSLELVDKALAIAQQEKVIFCSFGDMLRVPGSTTDLLALRAQGCDIRVVYSPLDAVRIAQENPDNEVIFFAIGFETTAPVNAASVKLARCLNLVNFSLLTSLVCVPPAMKAILGSSGNKVQGFLAAGHVCAVMGHWEYEPIARQFSTPIVVTGFELVDILTGILKTIEQLEEGRATVENAYQRVVTRKGNSAAQNLIQEIFEPCDRSWRGIGLIPMSGLKLRSCFADFDAEEKFTVSQINTHESALCIAGDILKGLRKPKDCPAFGRQCTPENPLGAPMVSSEGACNAYFRYADNT